MWFQGIDFLGYISYEYKIESNLGINSVKNLDRTLMQFYT